MAKVLKYRMRNRADTSEKENYACEDVFSQVVIGWNEINEAIAKKEAYRGEYTIEDDGEDKLGQPMQLDVLEAQLTYTAMMTDTLLEV